MCRMVVESVYRAYPGRVNSVGTVSASTSAGANASTGGRTRKESRPSGEPNTKKAKPDAKVLRG